MNVLIALLKSFSRNWCKASTKSSLHVCSRDLSMCCARSDGCVYIISSMSITKIKPHYHVTLHSTLLHCTPTLCLPQELITCVLSLPLQPLIRAASSSHLVFLLVAIAKLLFRLNLLTSQPPTELDGHV